ncbi:MAG TPA: LuxR C-terminal-related transcriptional regulator [Candidatus Acidoferrales bacterium]|nr:LuxR C-terminal-related transcriptional regulator [Candidatus Acidoferrales bacterium]
MRGSAPVESRKRFSAKISNIRARSVYGLLLPSDTARFQLITEREREVMRLLVSNETNKQVAFDLHISVRTVEIHRRRIMEKLGLHSIGELVHLAIRNGIVEA